MVESKVKIHRIKEVLKSLSKKLTFLVAEMRTEKGGLRDQNFDAPEALPDPDENSDADDCPRGERLPTTTQSKPRGYLRRQKSHQESTSGG